MRGYLGVHAHGALHPTHVTGLLDINTFLVVCCRNVCRCVCICDAILRSSMMGLLLLVQRPTIPHLIVGIYCTQL